MIHKHVIKPSGDVFELQELFRKTMDVSYLTTLILRPVERHAAHNETAQRQECPLSWRELSHITSLQTHQDSVRGQRALLPYSTQPLVHFGSGRLVLGEQRRYSENLFV